MHRAFDTAGRMGGRAVEGTGLENRQTLAGLVGSNPTPSAINISENNVLYNVLMPAPSFFPPILYWCKGREALLEVTAVTYS